MALQLQRSVHVDIYDIEHSQFCAIVVSMEVTLATTIIMCTMVFLSLSLAFKKLVKRCLQLLVVLVIAVGINNHVEIESVIVMSTQI